jgi:hypothetical protein
VRDILTYSGKELWDILYVQWLVVRDKLYVQGQLLRDILYVNCGVGE